MGKYQTAFYLDNEVDKIIDELKTKLREQTGERISRSCVVELAIKEFAKKLSKGDGNE